MALLQLRFNIVVLLVKRIETMTAAMDRKL